VSVEEDLESGVWVNLDGIEAFGVLVHVHVHVPDPVRVHDQSVNVSVVDGESLRAHGDRGESEVDVGVSSQAHRLQELLRLERQRLVIHWNLLSLLTTLKICCDGEDGESDYDVSHAR